MSFPEREGTSMPEAYGDRLSRCSPLAGVLLLVSLVGTAQLAVPSRLRAEEKEDRPVSRGAIAQPQAEKRTTLGLYVTASEAYAKWRAAPEEVKVIDVRTAEEFLFVGHPAMAWNIPFAKQTFEWNAEKHQFPMQPLTDFVDRVRKVAAPDEVLLVMCRSGGRGALAVNALAQAGFTAVYNVTDGMEGDEVKDPESVFNGQRLVNGWKNSGLPWTYEVDPARMLLPGAR